MTKKIKMPDFYRPYFPDYDHEIRKEINELCRKYPHLRKQWLEKSIFKAGIPVIKANLEAVRMG